MVSSSRSVLSDPGMGLVFTDARGRVVFVDNKVLALLGQLETGRLVGEPLHRIFQVAFEVVNGLLTEIARTGYVHERPLVITRSDGTQIETVCTGIASYDDQHTFIGADFTLRDPATAAPRAPATHGDILGVRIQQIEAEADAQVASADAQVAEGTLLAQLYFTALLGAVQVLLNRMGGQRVSDAMEGVVNKRAAQSGWPVRLADGQFVLDPANLPEEAYHTLIDEVVGYARNVTGSRLLFQEMHALDEQMPPSARENAGKLGLRGWAG